MIDLLVQMLSAVLPHAEAIGSGAGIKSKGLEFTITIASAIHLYLLPPVFGPFWRLLAAGQKELGGMAPQPLELLIAEDRIAVFPQ